jgi:hypothetical protein
MGRRVRTRAAAVLILIIGVVTDACAPVYLPEGRLPAAQPLRLDPVAGPTGTLRLSSPQFLGSVERVTREAGLFARFVIEPESTRAPSTDYTVTISVSASPRQPTGAQIAYNLTAAVTLAVLPLTREMDLTLRATVADRGGQVLRAYQFEDSVREIQQVATILLPVGAVLSLDRAAARVIENMPRHLYRQIDADRLLSLPSSPPAPAGGERPEEVSHAAPGT